MHIALTTLNSGGTKGHSVPLKRLYDAIQPKADVFLVSQSMDADISLTPQKLTKSVGGSFSLIDSKNIVEQFKEYDISVAVFSTFFSPQTVKDMRSEGIRTAMLTYPLRDSHEHIIAERNLYENFDVVFEYEDYFQMERIPSTYVSPLKSNLHQTSTEGDILFTYGGGGRPSLDAYVSLVSEVIPQLEQRITIVDPQEKFNDLSKHKHIRRVNWVENLESLMSQHSLVISESGYHTIADLRNSQTPSILIPGARRIDNQELRAIYHESTGAGITVLPEESPAVLLKSIEQAAYLQKSAPGFSYDQVDEVLLDWLNA